MLFTKFNCVVVYYVYINRKRIEIKRLRFVIVRHCTEICVKFRFIFVTINCIKIILNANVNILKFSFLFVFEYDIYLQVNLIQSVLNKKIYLTNIPKLVVVDSLWKKLL